MIPPNKLQLSVNYDLLFIVEHTSKIWPRLFHISNVQGSKHKVHKLHWPALVNDPPEKVTGIQMGPMTHFVLVATELDRDG